MASPDLIFLHGQSVPRCTHDIDKRFTDYQTLQYMNGGGVELGIDAEVHHLRGRWFWSAYPGPRIRFRADRAGGSETWVHRYVAFRGPLVSRWTAEGLFPIVRPQRPAEGKDCSKRFDELLGLSKRTDRWGHLRAVHVLEGILLELAEARAQPAGSQPWVAEAIERLAAGAEGELPNYAEVAASMGMAESTFRRRFRQATGTPPHVYVLQCRVASARQMLGETDLPIKEIARRLGYRDVYFFSRQFRQLAGVPPAVYRRSRQG